MISMNLSHIAILNIKSSDYNLISKAEQNLVIELLKNADLTEKSGNYETETIYF